MSITFTQIISPDQTKKVVIKLLPPSVENMAVELIKRGFFFYVEHNRREQKVFLSCLNDDTNQKEELACMNGPAVPLGVEDLIRKSHQRFIGAKNAAT